MHMVLNCITLVGINELVLIGRQLGPVVLVRKVGSAIHRIAIFSNYEFGICSFIDCQLDFRHPVDRQDSAIHLSYNRPLDSLALDWNQILIRLGRESALIGSLP